jgi:hypothetical protein
VMIGGNEAIRESRPASTPGVIRNPVDCFRLEERSSPFGGFPLAQE